MELSRSGCRRSGRPAGVHAVLPRHRVGLGRLDRVVEEVDVRQANWQSTGNRASLGQTIGVRDAGGLIALESLKTHLRDRQVLLVLDKFEQVLGAAPGAAHRLQATSGHLDQPSGFCVCRASGKY